MISHQLRNSGSLLDSIDAIRNWRAVGLLLATFVCMALVLSLGGVVGQFSYFLAGPFVLLAYAAFFYGANAVGMMMMDEARGGESRSATSAVAASLTTSHRLILVFLLLAALYLAGLLALAVVLLICKIPFFGAILYTVVFPVSVIVAGLALFAVPMVIFPLAAPAIWGGAGTMACISQMMVIVRRRLVMVLLLMLAVSLLATVVGLLISAILFTGVGATAVVSVPILGSMPGVASATGSAGATVGSGHALAAAIGGGLLVAVAFTLPGMVYLRGASAVYLQAIDGLDLASEQAEMDERLVAAAARARAMQARAQAAAQAAAQKYTASPATPAPPPIEPQWVPPASTPGTDPHEEAPPAAPSPATSTSAPTSTSTSEPAPTAAPVCARCGAKVAPGDMACAACGNALV